MTQQICLEFWSAGEGVCPRNPLPYLYGMAARILCDYRRRTEREGRYLVVNSELVNELISVGFGGVQRSMSDSAELQERVVRALAQLSPRHAAVLISHKHDGFSYRETAQRLGLSVHTVEKYVAQAKAQLRVMQPGRKTS